MEFSFEKLPVLLFVKQVITMFCSLLPVDQVKRLGFDTFLLSKQSNQIDKTQFDIRMYLTPMNVGQLMVGPTLVFHETETGIDTTEVCDLGVFPFGFILNLTPDKPVEYGTSIMDFFDAKYNMLYSGSISLMYLERKSSTLPLPLVFKPLAQTSNGNNW